MPLIEVLGYMAAGAIFATFWMKKMIPLRVIGMCGNVLFLSYGLVTDIIHIVLLHGALFPLNALRLYQAAALRRKIQEISAADFKVKSLLPFMSEHKVPKGEYLFRQGDPADYIYYLSSGEVRLMELNKKVEPGSMVGEIGMFTPTRQRTQSVLCEDDAIFLRISEEKILEMYADNPVFGVYLIKMIVVRLLDNSTSEAPVKT